jgi:hypothetical protein
MTIISPIIRFLIQPQPPNATPILRVELANLNEDQDEHALCQNLNGAFLAMLAGERHPRFAQAHAFSEKLASSREWGDYARFYLEAAQLIFTELDQRGREDAELKAKFQRLEAVLAEHPNNEVAITEAIWSVLFPEGVGIRGQEDARVAALREKRTVTIRELNGDPIRHPAEQMLFTSNVLLTIPHASADLDQFDQDFKAQLELASTDPQLYWYDHPIPIGVGVENNEILYGLRNFNQAVEVEHRRQPEKTTNVKFVLSVSVTHERLQTLAKRYLKQALRPGSQFDRLNIYAFTETDTNAFIHQVFLPIIERSCPRDDAGDLLAVFGVDGRYGRHYSFLKAIAALWNVLIDPKIKATFKIDLDQVFPQSALIEQTGASAFEHFKNPIWGASGRDLEGRPIELGMIAGALVHQRDSHRGLFTPDVTFPKGDIRPDEYVFFSALPQALSTEAEMMTRYQSGSVPDGLNNCLQRIHVTGGTNGILVDSLRRFRPFTPSFIARAEDQAYLLSTFGQGDRLGYVHAAGLIMRHDKESFAQEAITMAEVGKQIGDYLRILMFSAYAEALPQPVSATKEMTDPFTGCFISRLPITVSVLRFALKVAMLFNDGKPETACEFMRVGIPQLREGLRFTGGGPSPLQQKLRRERHGWQLFYDALEAIEQALQEEEAWALELQKTARRIVAECRIN